MEVDKLRDKSSPRIECLRFWESEVEDMAKDANERPMKEWRDDCKIEILEILINVEVIIRKKKFVASWDSNFKWKMKLDIENGNNKSISSRIRETRVFLTKLMREEVENLQKWLHLFDFLAR